jgi:hypothetical protein
MTKISRPHFAHSRTCPQVKCPRSEKSRNTVEERIGARRSEYLFSKCGLPCLTILLQEAPRNQAGWVMPSDPSLNDGLSGVEKPFRMLFSRLAATGVSTVTTNVSNPGSLTRSVKALIRALSPGR